MWLARRNTHTHTHTHACCLRAASAVFPHIPFLRSSRLLPPASCRAGWLEFGESPTLDFSGDEDLRTSAVALWIKLRRLLQILLPRGWRKWERRLLAQRFGSLVVTKDFSFSQMCYLNTCDATQIKGPVCKMFLRRPAWQRVSYLGLCQVGFLKYGGTRCSYIWELFYG